MSNGSDTSASVSRSPSTGSLSSCGSFGIDLHEFYLTVPTSASLGSLASLRTSDALVPTAAAGVLQVLFDETPTADDLQGLFDQFAGIESNVHASGGVDDSVSGTSFSFEDAIRFAGSFDTGCVSIVGGVPTIEEVDDNQAGMMLAVAERNANIDPEVHCVLDEYRKADEARRRQGAPLHATIGHYKRRLAKPP